MDTTKANQAVCVLTARGIEMILSDGGSQAWVLDADRARQCEFAICVQNCGFPDNWGKVSASHHTAFLVGRISEVARSEESGDKRWILKFSEYAKIDLPNAWPGNRNPVLYTDLQQFGIDAGKLKFLPMPTPKPSEATQVEAVRPMTLADAKAGLALAFGVQPSQIDITVRA